MMMIKLLPALVLTAAFGLAACEGKKDGQDQSPNDSSKKTMADDHDHADHADHADGDHDHALGNTEIGKVTLLGRVCTVFQAGYAEEGKMADYEVAVENSTGVVLRGWYGDAEGIELSVPVKAHAHSDRLGFHPRLMAGTAADAKLWIELEHEGKREKGSVTFRRR